MSEGKTASITNYTIMIIFIFKVNKNIAVQIHVTTYK